MCADYLVFSSFCIIVSAILTVAEFQGFNDYYRFVAMKLKLLTNPNSRFFSLCRPDRDKYLDVIKSNIRPDKLGQYALPVAGFMRPLEKDIPYDYFSIMHYGKSLFEKKDADVSINK